MTKNGPLTARHLTILRAIQRLQPCSTGRVAVETKISVSTCGYIVFEFLYRRGLVDSGVVNGRRRNGTIRLTEEGERMLDACV